MESLIVAGFKPLKKMLKAKHRGTSNLSVLLLAFFLSGVRPRRTASNDFEPTPPLRDISVPSCLRG